MVGNGIVRCAGGETADFKRNVFFADPVEQTLCQNDGIGMVMIDHDAGMAAEQTMDRDLDATVDRARMTLGRNLDIPLDSAGGTAHG